MTASELRSAIQRFTEAVREENGSLDVGTTGVLLRPGKGEEVTWISGPGVPIYDSEEADTITSYRTLLRARAYNVLLRSGALFQLSATFQKGALSGYRFVYRPCPVSLPSDLDVVLETLALDDIIEERLIMDATAIEPCVVQRSALRLEYAPESRRSGHPATHLHINSPNCRVPVGRLVSLPRFLVFVAEHFEPGIAPATKRISASWPLSEDDQLSTDERRSPHLWYQP